jgi:uncharacterized membrane protein YfcA
MVEIYYLIAVIALFSAIQSIFGVGILLFGTPTLLLLEYSYSETLWILLPCSVTISLIQVVNGYKLIEAKKRAIYLVIPTLVLFLALVVTYANGINMTRIVGVLLLLIGIIRFSNKLQALLSSMVKRHIQIYYIIIGVVHGVSNMGGGPLSIIMSTIYSKKEVIRANVAFVYLILAIFQLIVLSTISNAILRNEVLWLIPISMVSYIFTSKFISLKVNDRKYAFVLNLMVLVYGVLAIIK